MNMKTRILGYVTAVAALVGSGSAMAVLPAGASSAFTEIQTDALALVDLAWPAVIAVTIAFILLKLFKKSANKIG